MQSGVKYLVLGLVSLLLSQTQADAHEQAVGLTEITLAAPEGTGVACLLDVCRIEVAHRFSIHDAESTLMSVLGARADLVGDQEAQGKFEAYVAERFALSDPETGFPVPLLLLGGEVERGYYWVYQEGLMPEGLLDLSISQGVLMDAIPRQTNRVNVHHQGEVKTLVFSGGAGPQTLSFR